MADWKFLMSNLIISLVLLLSIFPAYNGDKVKMRDLATIRYHLTTCGSSGRLGSTGDQQCIDYYRDQNTPIARDGLILQQPESLFFRGAQLIKLPRNTVYNVTIAGASGGRGLCSPVYGRGVVINAQMMIEASFNMLVLVGQKGEGPCEFLNPPSDSVCSLLNDVVNATKCNETWWNYIHGVAGYTDGLDVYQHTGGGGGGGGSMIRLENEEGLQVFPFLMAGGGGGGAAVLDTNSINTINFTYTENALQSEKYQEFIDGKRKIFDPVLSERQNQRGFVAPSLTDDRTAGAGGGYVSGFDDARRVDGSQFVFEDAFGEGGTDCGTSSLVPTTFTAEVGGFGAGGGGCGGGGGGGGQTGGAIIGSGNLIPGGGGYSFIQDSSKLKVIEYGWNKNGDGYVDIVPADCGCVGECIIYEEEDQFECLCPNYTQLAPDLSDCYHVDVRQVEHTDWSIDSRYSFTLVDFGSSVYIFSIETVLSTTSEKIIQSGSGERDLITSHVNRNDNNGDLLCTIVFIGADENVVLVSTPARSDNTMATRLAGIEVNFTNGSVIISEFTDFLSSSELVTGALLISQGDCYIEGGLLMNVSLMESNETGSGEYGYPGLRDKLISNPETTELLAMEILHQHEKPTELDVDTNTTISVEHIIIIAVFSVALSLIVSMSIFILCIWCHCKENRKAKQKRRFLNIAIPSSSTSSLTSNAVYVSNRDTISPQGNKYSTNCFQLDASYRYYTEALCESNPRRIQESFEVGKRAAVTSVIIPPVQHDFCDFNRSRSKSTFEDVDWQYPRKKLIYMRELGEGQFGKVLLMKAEQGIAGYRDDIPVAVKTLSSRDPEMGAKFMEEAELMKKFSHPNIISLLGVSTCDVLDDDNAPLMILEYMPYGDLHAFLKRNKPESQTVQVTLLDTHFINFASDVAKALEFLTQLKYVHRDIAARNCLVGTGLMIKISDFGLARRLNSKNYFTIEGSGVLPIRSMATECFITGKFTTASDVWSYGVLLWEIASFGAIPLPGLTALNIAEFAVSKKLQHVIPPECPPVLSSLITQCHNHDPDKRPSFTDILTQLSSA